ncbi:MAG TPA: hypothetical protein VLQ79_14300, partial [Myxococcaceae bacterium]|nr:hypothetical protein [Myxococcaceae bacterium]
PRTPHRDPRGVGTGDRVASGSVLATRTEPPDPRRDTPARGWERGVWHRIDRRHRVRRLGGLAITLVATLCVAVVFQRFARPEQFPALISTELEGSRRPNGSVPLQTVWDIHFEGAELRVYRDDLVVQRCPGSAGCTRTDRGGRLALRIDAPGEYRALAFTRPSGPGTALGRELALALEDENPVQMSSPLIAY